MDIRSTYTSLLCRYTLAINIVHVNLPFPLTITLKRKAALPFWRSGAGSRGGSGGEMAGGVVAGM